MKPERDEHREERIAMGAIVDAYGPEEQAIGWYCYLESDLCFPFEARCHSPKSTSPLKKEALYLVKRMADVEDCSAEMYVMVDFNGDELSVPLSQLIPIGEVTEETNEAILDWHYWVARGHQF